MHLALIATKQKLEARKQVRGGVPQGYTPPNLKHDRMITLRVVAGVSDAGRFDFLIRACPKCLRGYVYELTQDTDDDIKLITQAQWKQQIKPYTVICSEKEGVGNAEQD